MKSNGAEEKIEEKGNRARKSGNEMKKRTSEWNGDAEGSGRGMRGWNRLRGTARGMPEKESRQIL